MNNTSSLIAKAKCWWFGCDPNYDAIVYETHKDEWSDIIPCKRCGACDISYADLVGDTRHNRTVNWLRTGLYEASREEILEFVTALLSRANKG